MPAKGETEYDYELCKEICEYYASGMGIMDALKQDKRFPVWSTFRRWKRDNKDLQTLYACAREDKAEPDDNKIDDILKKLEAGEIDPATARVLIDAIKWKMSKYNKNVYGDSSNVDVTSGGDKIQDRVVRIEVVPMDSPKE
jgi:hypothetical protein